MAKERNRVIDYLVYLVVRLVVCALQMLPMSAGYAAARWLALLGYWLDKRHRNVALENLRHAFGDRYSEPERQELVFRVYEHFARMIVEIVHIPRKMHVYNYKRYCSFEVAPGALTVLLSTRSRILVTGHFGNWEMAGFLLAAFGAKSHAIARTLDNPHLHAFLLRFRQWTGQTILAKNGDFDRIQEVLSTGGLLVSVGDQSAGPRGQFVDFFGRPASTHKAIAILARQFNAPILVGYAFRTGRSFRYRLCINSPIDPKCYADTSKGVMAMTQEFTTQLERAIRVAPEQYFWLHNRWKHSPPAKARRSAAA